MMSWQETLGEVPRLNCGASGSAFTYFMILSFSLQSRRDSLLSHPGMLQYLRGKSWSTRYHSPQNLCGIKFLKRRHSHAYSTRTCFASNFRGEKTGKTFTVITVPLYPTLVNTFASPPEATTTLLRFIGSVESTVETVICLMALRKFPNGVKNLVFCTLTVVYTWVDTV